ncbi:class I SAM-dependent methyltransferase [Thalassotalea euphylliae]|uniref:class I SAM-dependent methyltransferase n=1 Tax=Thalassotalea euphylliae TaxID=1655234 RepID=UPI0036265D8F
MSSLIEHIDFSKLSESQRLFHGRGHAYPGFEHICIDWYEPLILITLYKEESVDVVNTLANQLMEKVPACKSVQVQHRWQARAPFTLVLGDEVTSVEALESGLKYNISLGNAQNTGLFLDMKKGRDWVQANSSGKNVLNLFSYTCAFSIAAHAGGANQIVNIDLSKASLSRGRDNHHLNKQSTDKVVFQGLDIFKSFGRIKKYGPYQLVIIDPPSFQKGSVNIEKDYHKIVRRIPEFVSPGGHVMLCLNNPDLTDEFLTDMVTEYCPALTYREHIYPPEVFKEAQKGRGLKVMIFDYLPD